jgi:hypothetical protein
MNKNIFRAAGRGYSFPKAIARKARRGLSARVIPLSQNTSIFAPRDGQEFEAFRARYFGTDWALRRNRAPPITSRPRTFP